MGGVPKFDRLRLDCDDIDRSRDWRENAFDGSPRVGMNQMPRHVEERVQYQSMSPRARTVLFSSCCRLSVGRFSPLLPLRPSSSLPFLPSSALLIALFGLGLL